MKNMLLKIGIIGGGSIFTPELIDLFARYSDALGEIEIRLMDIDEQRLKIVGGLCERIIRKSGKPILIKYVDDYKQAIQGADFILVQFRVGGEDARIEDDKLGMKYKIPFVETVSVCGFSAYLRTYYELEKIALLINEFAPDAWIMNFTNPAGMLAQTLYQLGCKKTVGVCNSSIFFRDYFAGVLNCSPDDVLMNWRGLNHLTVIDSIKFDGEEVFLKLVEMLESKASTISPFPVSLVKALGYIPNYYLQYNYLKEKVVEQLQSRPRTRAEEVKEVNARILESYKTIDHVPDELKQRGGYGYSRAVANLVKGVVTGDCKVHYAVIKNGSVLPELPFDSFVEVPVITQKNEIKAIQVDPLPETIRALLITMNQYERMLVTAARERSLKGLLNALLVHPLIGSYTLAEPLLQDVIKVNRNFLPQFSPLP